MTKEELAENILKCYNSLPDNGEDALETLIATSAFFIEENVETSIDEAIIYFRDSLVRRLKLNNNL